MLWVVADLRSAPYAAPAFRTRAFYNGHGSVFLPVRTHDGEGCTVAEDVAACTAQVRAAVAGFDGAVHMCLRARAGNNDEEGKAVAALLAQAPFPDVVSNIGVFPETHCPRLQLHDTVAPAYYTAFYAYRGARSDQLQLLFCHPSTLDPQIPKALKEEFFSVVAEICRCSSD